mmetsp:Transcript_29404/g.28553  ORF Transcript_29404/g.28553 Transcript_29404/m.28553 type:complete len:130 (-) Transcript_29404:25-414(-)
MSGLYRLPLSDFIIKLFFFLILLLLLGSFIHIPWDVQLRDLFDFMGLMGLALFAFFVSNHGRGLPSDVLEVLMDGLSVFFHILKVLLIESMTVTALPLLLLVLGLGVGFPLQLLLPSTLHQLLVRVLHN